MKHWQSMALVCLLVVLYLMSVEVDQRGAEIRSLQQNERYLEQELELEKQARQALEIEIGLLQIRYDLLLQQQARFQQRELDCLARNVFYEAGVEDMEGKLVVAQVTHNRLEVGRWGETICEVVYAPAQFSWTAIPGLAPPSGPLWRESKRAAREFLAGARVPGLEQALFYHADYIEPPDWAANKQRLAQVGRHIFYKPRRTPNDLP